MFMFKKLAAFVVAVAILAGAFVLLAMNARNASNNSLAAIQKRGVLVVATSADYPPFEYQTLVDGKDTTAGSDVDLAKIIAAKLGVKLEIQNMNFNTVLLAVTAGKADLGISAISATDERKQSFDFTDTYYTPTNKLIIQKVNFAKFPSISSLDGSKIGAQKGSIQESVVQDQLPNAKEIGLVSIPDLVNEVKMGTMDGVMVEGIVGENYIANDPSLTFANLPLVNDASQSFSIALEKGDSSLKDRLNEILRELKNDGTIDRLIIKNSEEVNKK
jgi:polar amino acid transport system substrate-binding protein